MHTVEKGFSFEVFDEDMKIYKLSQKRQHFEKISNCTQETR